jgi:hypothetical protein
MTSLISCLDDCAIYSLDEKKMTKQRVTVLIVIAVLNASPLILDKLPSVIRAVKETPQLIEEQPSQSAENN